MITQTPASNASNLTNLQQSSNTQNTSNKPQANFSATNSFSDSSRNGFLLNNLLNILEQLIRSMGDHQPQLATSNPSSGDNLSSGGSPVQNNIGSNNGNAQDNVTGNTSNTQNNVNTNSPVLLNPTFDVNGGINSVVTGLGQPNNPGTSQDATPAQSNNLVSMFNGRDQTLLLGALGIAPGSGATISRIDDVNGSGTLNSGDNIVLQTPGGLQNHTVTDAEVRSFINQRNPIGTPKLSLNSQQSALLQNSHGFTNVQVADINGDGRLSEGDLVTGTTRQGLVSQQLDIPIDAALLQQLGGSGVQGDTNTQGTAGTVQGNNMVSMFSDRDQNLLLSAIGVAPGSGANITGIIDVNGSGTLNSGDTLVLQTANGVQNHTVTDAEVRNFIEQRNPIGTPKLSLNSQQSSLLQNLHGFTSAQIADLDGDGQLSVGDLITGNTRQGTTTQRLDIPVDVELLAQLGNSGAQQQGDNVQSDNFILGANNPGGGNGLAGNNNQGQ